MTGIAGLGSPFTTTPSINGYYGFGSLGTLISGFPAEFPSIGGYPTTGQASNLALYGLYIESNPFGSAYTRVGDVFENFGAPRLDLGGIGTDAFGIQGLVFGSPVFKANVGSSVYFIGNVNEFSGANTCGFFASEFSGQFSINAGSSPSNPPIEYNQGALSFNVVSIQIDDSQCYNYSAVVGSPVKNLVIIDETGTPRAIPLYDVPR